MKQGTPSRKKVKPIPMPIVQPAPKSPPVASPRPPVMSKGPGTMSKGAPTMSKGVVSGPKTMKKSARKR